MKLSLIYQSQDNQGVCGAFVKGARPEIWLKEMNQWGINWAQMICFPIPESIQSVQAQGVFVIFAQEESLSINPQIHSFAENILHPYTKWGESLYIPLNTTLYPSLLPEELDEMLLWDYQVFHPEAGLIGFSKEDQIQLQDLVAFTPPLAQDWGFALAGPPPTPPLTEISISQPDPEELIEAFKEELKTKSLKDILEEEEQEDSSLGSMFRNLGINTLQGALSASDRLKDWIDENTDDEPQDYSPEGGPGLLDQFDSWASQKLNNLRNEQEKEVNRLLELFKKNPEEALRYALPLHSPYHKRGNANPSNRLSSHNTNFNLHQLGGGGAEDGWALNNNQYQLLLQHYHDEAKKCLESEDYRKAAYIYAHLLGDYMLAVNALEQGKYYREAAAMYKEHLKKPEAAAECLERGGLLSEAIDLYLELNKYEKAGDLSLTIGRKKAAMQLYQKTYDQALERDDYMDAVRLLEVKLNQTSKIPNLLLEGWRESARKEACLNKYIAFIWENEPEILAESVKKVYQNELKANQRDSFLRVLKNAHKLYPSEELAQASTEIVFEMVSDDIQQDKLRSMEALTTFLPEDKLVYSDINRYKYLHKEYTPKVEPPSDLLGVPLRRFALDSSVQWKTISTHYQYVVALGLKNNLLHIATCDRDGKKIELHSWSGKINMEANMRLFFSDTQSTHLLMSMNPNPGKVNIKIGEQTFYKGIQLCHYPWISKRTLSLYNDIDSIVALERSYDHSQLSFYGILTGELKSSHSLTLSGNLSPNKNHLPNKMLRYEESYYTFSDSLLLKIEPKDHGRAEVNYSPFAADIKDFLIIQGHENSLVFVICTTEGCWIVKEINNRFEIISQIFADQIPILGISQMSPGIFAVAARNEILLYQLDLTSPGHPELMKHFTVQENLQAILPSMSRGQIAAFTEEGEVVFY